MKASKPVRVVRCSRCRHALVVLPVGERLITTRRGRELMLGYGNEPLPIDGRRPGTRRSPGTRQDPADPRYQVVDHFSKDEKCRARGAVTSEVVPAWTAP